MPTFCVSFGIIGLRVSSSETHRTCLCSSNPSSNGHLSQADVECAASSRKSNLHSFVAWSSLILRLVLVAMNAHLIVPWGPSCSKSVLEDGGILNGFFVAGRRSFFTVINEFFR